MRNGEKKATATGGHHAKALEEHLADEHRPHLRQQPNVLRNLEYFKLFLKIFSLKLYIQSKVSARSKFHFRS